MKRRAILLSLFSMLGLLLVIAVSLHPQIAAGQDQPPGETPTPVPVAGDYGDAPDSSNNQAVSPNTAYPGIPGNFPTSYQNTAAGNPAGPVHLNPNRVFLGDGVSGEFGADFGPDQDSVNNIVNGGLDNADNDGFDDGWLNQDVPFPHCDRTTLEVRVSRDAAVVNPNDMYLNVWFDGNRNGQWGDQAPCPQAEVFPVANEWIVQNSVINVAAIPAGGSLDFVINTARVPNGFESDSHWIRFTLTEDPLPNIARDGRGAFPPAGHDFGETEDYLYTPLPTGGDPGSIIITKTFGTADPVLPGDVVDVIIDLKHEGGTLARTGRLRDLLPDGVSYLGPITVNSLGVVSNLTANYNNTVNGVSWNGTLQPESSIRLKFPVEVDYCFGTEDEVITNTATYTGSAGNEWSADADLVVDCVDVDLTDITIERRIKTYEYAGGTYDPQGNPGYFLPGEHVLVETIITNDSNLVVPIGIDHKLEYLRPDLQQTQYSNRDRVEEFISAQGSIVLEHWLNSDDMQSGGNFAYHPSGVVESTILVCLLDLDDNDCAGSEYIIADDPFVFEVEMSDLGDAPDSSNHHGVDMEAYPGVVANFPTVYDPTLPGLPGPLITNTHTLRLGEWSSYEVEADTGPDSIFSFITELNNIDPVADLANQESSSDDGLIQPNLNVASCEQTSITLEIHPTQGGVDYFKNETADGNAYINVFVDGNRNGQWGDVEPCGSDTVSEHIVINHPVNISNQTGNFPFYPVVPTGQVMWTTGAANISHSRWMRVMITDRPVDLIDGSYSNGGSDAVPYLFGEIEDHLVNNENYPILNPDQQAPVDIGVGLQNPRLTEPPVGFRRGAATANRDYYRFTADYGNLGSNPASPTMTLSLVGTDVEIERITVYNRSNRELVSDQHSPCADPATCAVSLGEIASGEIGKAQVFFSVPAGTTQNDIVIDVAIEDPNDTNPANNKQKLTFKPSYIPRPIIDTVEIGDAGSGQHTVTLAGLALPNIMVQVGIQNSTEVYSATATTDNNGRWSATINPVSAGSYEAAAFIKAEFNGPPSRRIPFIVSDLPTISRLSLIDADGRDATVTINDLDSIFDWGLLFNLTPGDYQLEAELNNVGDDVEIVLYSQSLEQYVTLADYDDDGIYTGDFTIDGPISRTADTVSHDLVIMIKSGDTETIYTAKIGVTSEASAVTDADSSAPLTGANVTAYAESVGGLNGEIVETFTQWTNTSGQPNPAVSDTNGQYSFIVESGSYRLLVNAAGYQPYRTVALPNTKGLLSSPIGLTKSIAADPAARVLLDEQNSTAIVMIEPGEVVEFSNIENEAQLVGDDDWDSGLLLPGESYKRQFNTAGTYTLTSDGQNNITIVVGDGDGPSDIVQIFLPMAFR